VSAVQLALLAVGVYAAVGVVFSLAYAARIAPARDGALRASGWSVRLLLIPGAVAVWPLLLRGTPGGRAMNVRLRRRHLAVWFALAPLAVAAVAAAVLLRVTA